MSEPEAMPLAEAIAAVDSWGEAKPGEFGLHRIARALRQGLAAADRRRRGQVLLLLRVIARERAGRRRAEAEAAQLAQKFSSAASLPATMSKRGRGSRRRAGASRAARAAQR